jgi:hypothetical protein
VLQGAAGWNALALVEGGLFPMVNSSVSPVLG